jgi:hypothetical protein
MNKTKFTEPPRSDNDLLWVMKAIAEEAQLVPNDDKKLYYHIPLGHLKSVKKICGRYVARRGALRAELDGRERVDLIARTGSNIVFREGMPGLVLLDFDTKGISSAIADRIGAAGGFWGALVSVLPALAEIGRVERASTSAGLYRRDTGERLRGSDGRHVYIGVVDGADAARFLKALHTRCWIAGFGWLLVGKAGQLLERSIVDFTVGSPERLVFEGPPVLEYPLAQDAIARKPVATRGAIFHSVQACPPLSAADMARMRELLAREEHGLASAIAAARDNFIVEETKRLVERGVAPAVARRAAQRFCQGVLLPDVVLPWDDPHLVARVGNVLDDPARFEGETLADPLEGVEYGRCKAKVLRRADGGASIHSFAHGGTVYELQPDANWVAGKLRAAANEDLLDILLRWVPDLPPSDDDELIDIVQQRTKRLKGAIKTAIKAAREAAARERWAEAQRRRRAQRRDPRPQLDAPARDAEFLPVMHDIVDVLGANRDPEPPVRDIDGFLTAVHVRRMPKMHLFSSTDANAEGNEETRLPPPEQPLLTRLDVMQAAELIEKHIEYINDYGRAVHLNDKFVAHFRKRDDGLSTVTAISTLPIVLPTGQILLSRGLNREHGIIFRIPDELMAMLPNSSGLTDTKVAEAMRFLCHEWLCDVATDFIGKCILIANALTIIERSVLPDRPAFAISGGKRGAGKTTTIIMVMMAVTGLRPPAAAWSTNEEERRKALLAYLLEGIPAIIWDNIARGSIISCPHIEKACTSSFYTDRRLGVSETVAASAAAVHIFTGNNFRLGGDLASRTLSMRLDAERADPENRVFKHPDPIAWTEANRGKILTALYTILLANPRLRRGTNSAAETRFKMWWHLVGSAVEHAASQLVKLEAVEQAVKQFGLAVEQQVATAVEISFKEIFINQEEDEGDAADLADALEALMALGTEFEASDAARIANEETNPDGRVIKEFFCPTVKPEQLISPKSMGRRLAKHLDEPVRKDNRTLKLTKRTDTHSKDTFYSVSVVIAAAGFAE